MKNKVFGIISKVMEVPVDEINEDSSPDTLEKWDSLQHMTLILAFEEEFDVSFTDTEIVDMINVKVIMEKLEGRRKYV